MPHPSQPPSLREASLQSIARNYNYLCTGQSPSRSDFISPFQGLSDDIIQELILLLSRECDIMFLFHSNIHVLRLRSSECYTSDSCIQLLGTTCQKLTHLNLEGITVQPVLLRDLVSSLAELVSLQLRDTNTDRSVLKAIVDNCPKLHHLNVEECHLLENSDFLLLCNQPERPRISLQLTNLKLTGWTYLMSTDTVVALLNTHPNLRSLGECELIDQALDRMYGKEYQLKKEFQQTWIHNLSEVTIYGHEERLVDLKLTTLCCPYLTTLSLDLSVGFIHSLMSASNLKSLEKLSLSGCTFMDVFPILEKIGGKLTSLCFHDIYEVCVFSVGALCPNLQSLHLTKTLLLSSIYNKPAAHHFRQLRVLAIDERWRQNEVHHLHDGYPEFDTKGLSKEALSMILENATEIKEMSFYSVTNLTDCLISEANKKHGFRFLTKAWFYYCRSIRKETAIILLSPDNPLENLRFQQCDVSCMDEYILQGYEHHRQVRLEVDIDPEIDMY